MSEPIKIIGLVGLIFLLFWSNNQNNKEAKRLEIFKICMSTIDQEILKDYSNLKTNIDICNELSNTY
ncbi:MAG: hypothetical protein QG566_63 [Patescibacteria group bacterium]|nr:hypothetical protein [Patescibacteria group bacterium]